MQAEVPFQLRLPGFEGPLELLLELSERAQLDITIMSLVEVAEQYLGYLRRHEPDNAAALADFVAIGARLLLLKSRRLLPSQADQESPSEPEPTDLAAAVEEYGRYREAAAAIRVREEDPGRCFPRLVPPPQVPQPLLADPLPPERLFHLLQQALARMPDEPVVEVPARIVTVAEKVEQLLSGMSRAGHVRFLAFIQPCTSRAEVVVCFIAILHLLKDGAIEATQPEPFGDIVLTPAQRGAEAVAG